MPEITRIDNSRTDRVIDLKIRINDITFDEATALAAALRAAAPALVEFLAPDSVGRQVEASMPFTTHRRATSPREGRYAFHEPSRHASKNDGEAPP